MALEGALMAKPPLRTNKTYGISSIMIGNQTLCAKAGVAAGPRNALGDPTRLATANNGRAHPAPLVVGAKSNAAVAPHDALGGPTRLAIANGGHAHPASIDLASGESVDGGQGEQCTNSVLLNLSLDCHYGERSLLG